MKGHTRSSSQRIGLHIPGPLIPAQDTSFMNKSNVPMNIPLDEPENIDENCNTRPRKSSNATKTQSSNKENEELKKLGKPYELIPSFTSNRTPPDNFSEAKYLR